jgi:hypothetical protein
MSAEDWLDDIKGAEDGEDSDDEQTSTLFEDNFRRMVEADDVESLNPQTIENQIDQIDDLELLAEAADLDDRDETREVYEDRVAQINAERKEDDEEPEDTEDESEADGTSDTVEMGDETEQEEVREEEPEPANGETEETAHDGDGSEEEEPEVEEAPQVESEEDEVEVPTESPEDIEEEIEEMEQNEEPSGGSDDLPDVDIGSLAPDAMTREEAAEADTAHTMLVWGQEGTGKTHVAHTAPEPIAYIDTEGKADEIADKFDKRVFYFQPDDYQEAKRAMKQAFNVLDKYREAGVTGTLVVDSITKLWEWSKEDYQELAYPSADSPDEVDFKSALQGENDWTQIKRRHNGDFRQRIIESPYHVVFTATAKEDYNAVIQDDADGKPMIPDGEKDNPYVVKDVVRLRVNDEGKTVADLHKSAKTRYSFLGLLWPEWDDIYDAIEMVAEAEASPDPVDVTQWPFDVMEGKPTYVSEDDENDD